MKHLHCAVSGWWLNQATGPQNVSACFWQWLRFHLSCHVRSNHFSLCLQQISVECKPETCEISQTARLFPSVAHCSLPPCLPLWSHTHTHSYSTHNTHPPTGFHKLPFDFIYCSRSVLIYLCSFTSHSDNLLSCLSAPCLSLLILSNLAPISVFLMASFEVRSSG